MEKLTGGLPSPRNVFASERLIGWSRTTEARVHGPMPTPKLEDLKSDAGAVNDLPVEAVPALLEEAQTQKGQLETVITLLSVRLAMLNGQAQAPHSEKPESEENLIDAKEAARITGQSPKWFYRHAKKLAFARRLSRKVLRFEEKGFRKWLAQKKLDRGNDTTSSNVSLWKVRSQGHQEWSSPLSL
jgi:predicted DNA-binding transcriptional regulator AlpA